MQQRHGESDDVRARDAAWTMPTCPRCAKSCRVPRRDGYKLKALVTAVALSDDFSMNVVPDADPVPAKTGTRRAAPARVDDNAPDSTTRGRLSEAMVFLTNRNCRDGCFCAGWGRRLALPFLESMLPAIGARAYATGVAHPFRRCFRTPWRWPGLLDPRIERTRVQISPTCMSRSSRSANTWF